MSGKVDHPEHYNVGEIEVVDAVSDWRLNFARGSIVKYVARAGHKAGESELDDLKKARWFLDYEVERLERGCSESPGEREALCSRWRERYLSGEDRPPPWERPNEYGEGPGAFCCQSVAGNRCDFHDPANYADGLPRRVYRGDLASVEHLLSLATRCCAEPGHHATDDDTCPDCFHNAAVLRQLKHRLAWLEGWRARTESAG